MKHSLSFLLILLFSQFSPAQTSDLEIFDEMSCTEYEHGAREGVALQRQIFREDERYFQQGAVRLTGVPEGRWKLQYNVRIDWEESIFDIPRDLPPVEITLNSISPPENSIVPLPQNPPMEFRYRGEIAHGYYDASDIWVFDCMEGEVWSGREIAMRLSLPMRMGTTAYAEPVQQFPVVYERGCRFNGDWTVFLMGEDRLVIRYVHSYPDGNATSWYWENRYYFERLK